MELLDFIICDDIRKEEGNKLSLMGVYNDRIEITWHKPPIKWPVSLRSLAFYFRFAPGPNGFDFEDFEFTIQSAHGKYEPIKGRVNIVNSNRQLALHFPIANFPIHGEGPIDFVFYCKKSNKTMKQFSLPAFWVDVKEIRK